MDFVLGDDDGVFVEHCKFEMIKMKMKMKMYRPSARWHLHISLIY